MSEPAVSAPGLPNATIIESSAQPAAPVTSSFQTDVAGMSASQAAAARFVDANRAEVQRTSDHILQGRVRDAALHAFGNAPAPAFLAGQLGVTPAAQQGAQASNADQPEHVDAMNSAELLHLHHHALAVGVPVDMAPALEGFVKAAQLPSTHAKILADRVAHHAKVNGDIHLAPEDRGEFMAAAAKSFGTMEKFEQVNARARAYVESIPGLAEAVDSKLAGTSLVFDPRILIALAGLADERGL